MRRLLLFAVLLLLSCPSGGAGGGLGSPSAGSPRPAFEHQTVDLGQVSRSRAGKQKCRFPFVNDGDAPLVVQEVETSCGCTQAVFTRKPVAPGGRGLLTVTFDPSSLQPGVFRRSIVVYTNAPVGFVRLFIKGTVVE